MKISTRGKVAVLVAGAVCIGGPATTSIAANLKHDGGAKTTFNEKRIPGPAGDPVDAFGNTQGKSAHGKKMLMLSTKSCGPTASDKAIARKISSKVNGSRLDGVDAGQVACARLILKATKSKGLNSRAGWIALMTAAAETTFHNYNGGDRDSMGLFQQRPSQGWGTPAQVTNPDYATKKFLSVMQQFYPNGKWKTGSKNDIAQAVQRSGVPDAYGKEEGATKVILDALWPGGGGPNPGPTNPYTPGKICGSGYKVIDSQALGKSGRAYLLYNSGNGKNCVTTLKATSLGKKSAVSSFLEVKGAKRSTDSGKFSYYAGPISKSASGKCVKWGGSVGTAAYTSKFEHCG
ncbi:hypothetical protein [Luteipulveratus mongoliensis]|uniref:hypothetical protein n=1 Tax=Luteipulveratus mongoliensis TaxID=571913 RepID=UPI000AB98EC7|nr:hypothetical protein [Luteipulveratus mongoliensis]